MFFRKLAVSLAALALMPATAFAQEESDAELAHKLANPVSSMISLPLQLNYDCCVPPGGEDGRYLLNVQPVLPLAINDEWNLIVRTIVPMAYDTGSEQTGFGDTTQSFFFSPQAKDGFTWAVGPALLYPTGTDGLSSAKWGLGPTALALKQEGRMTFGVLANHIWSVTGDSSHDDVNQTFVQPFFNYTLPDSTGIQINSESTYDWEREEWTIPINMGLTHIYNFSGQRVQFGLLGRAYVQTPPNGPDWGVRFVTTFLFPK